MPKRLKRKSDGQLYGWNEDMAKMTDVLEEVWVDDPEEGEDDEDDEEQGEEQGEADTTATEPTPVPTPAPAPVSPAEEKPAAPAAEKPALRRTVRRG